MLTGEIRNQVDRIWDAFWSGGISNPLEVIDPMFASAFLNSYGGRQYLLRAGSTTSGLNTISVSDVRDAPIAVPPIDLQRNFTRKLEAADKLKMSHAASLAELDTLFASLQHRAFRGEL